MEDISNVPSDTQKVPHSESPRTLRRTISCASIETVRPPSKKSIRRRIVEMADNLTLAARKSKRPLTQDLPKMAPSDPASDSKDSSERISRRLKRKSTTRLQASSHGSEEDILATADRLCDSILSEQDDPDVPSPFIECMAASPIHEPLSKGVGLGLDYDFLDEANGLEIQVVEEFEGTFQSARTSQIKDVAFYIQPFELDVTIWDGLETEHHMFKCRLFLQCITHPYDGIPLPDIQSIEVSCRTCPAGSRYALPPALQCTYEDTSSHRPSRFNAVADASLGAGIHVDGFWRTIMEDNGAWGWYKDAHIPLSSRLFDKIEYREFKVVGRVQVGEGFVEDELKFGISMLRREMNMK